MSIHESYYFIVIIIIKHSTELHPKIKTIYSRNYQQSKRRKEKMISNKTSQQNKTEK